MQRWSWFFFSVCPWLLASCIHFDRDIDQELAVWVGRSPDELVEVWGAPQSSYTMDKGPKVLSYEATESVSRYTSYFRRPDVYTFTESCKINFFY